MKKNLEHYVAKLQHFFQRKKVVEKKEESHKNWLLSIYRGIYKVNKEQSTKDDVLMCMYNDGFLDEAIELYEEDFVMTKEKLQEDANTFICLAALMIVGFFVIKIVF